MLPQRQLIMTVAAVMLIQVFVPISTVEAWFPSGSIPSRCTLGFCDTFTKNSGATAQVEVTAYGSDLPSSVTEISSAIGMKGTIFLLDGANNKIELRSTSDIGHAIKTFTVTGLTALTRLVSIDNRLSSDLVLYGMGSNGQLYKMDLRPLVWTSTNTVAAVKIGSAVAARTNGSFGGTVTFDPVTDQLRILGADGQTEWRVIPDTGAAAGGSTNDGTTAGVKLFWAAGDQHFGQSMGLSTVSYCQTIPPSPRDPAILGTKLWGIDTAKKTWVRVLTPGTGETVTIGNLGITGVLSPNAVVKITTTMARLNFGVALLTVNGIQGMYTIPLYSGVAAKIYSLGATAYSGITFSTLSLDKHFKVSVKTTGLKTGHIAGVFIGFKWGSVVPPVRTVHDFTIENSVDLLSTTYNSDVGPGGNQLPACSGDAYSMVLQFKPDNNGQITFQLHPPANVDVDFRDLMYAVRIVDATTNKVGTPCTLQFECGAVPQLPPPPPPPAQCYNNQVTIECDKDLQLGVYIEGETAGWCTVSISPPLASTCPCEVTVDLHLDVSPDDVLFDLEYVTFFPGGPASYQVAILTCQTSPPHRINVTCPVQQNTCPGACCTGDHFWIKPAGPMVAGVPPCITVGETVHVPLTLPKPAPGLGFFVDILDTGSAAVGCTIVPTQVVFPFSTTSNMFQLKCTQPGDLTLTYQAIGLTASYYNLPVTKTFPVKTSCVAPPPPPVPPPSCPHLPIVCTGPAGYGGSCALKPCQDCLSSFKAGRITVTQASADNEFKVVVEPMLSIFLDAVDYVMLSFTASPSSTQSSAITVVPVSGNAQIGTITLNQNRPINGYKIGGCDHSIVYNMIVQIKSLPKKSKTITFNLRVPNGVILDFSSSSFALRGKFLSKTWQVECNACKSLPPPPPPTVCINPCPSPLVRCPGSNKCRTSLMHCDVPDCPPHHDDDDKDDKDEKDHKDKDDKDKDDKDKDDKDKDDKDHKDKDDKDHKDKDDKDHKDKDDKDHKDKDDKDHKDKDDKDHKDRHTKDDKDCKDNDDKDKYKKDDKDNKYKKDDDKDNKYKKDDKDDKYKKDDKDKKDSISDKLKDLYDKFRK